MTPIANLPNSAQLHYPREISPLSMLKNFSKLASFAEFQFNSMNICIFSIKVPILVKICPTIIEIF